MKPLVIRLRVCSSKRAPGCSQRVSRSRASSLAAKARKGCRRTSGLRQHPDAPVHHCGEAEMEAGNFPIGTAVTRATSVQPIFPDESLRGKGGSKGQDWLRLSDGCPCYAADDFLGDAEAW